MEASSRLPGLHHEAVGDGAPMLVMHGGLGWDHTYLRPWLDPLATRHRLVYYDHRGNGRSDPAADPDTLDHGRWVDDAELLRTSLGLDRVIVFGHSYGGFLALECALRYPHAVAGLILSNTAPVVDFGEAIVANAQRKATPAQVQAVIDGLSTPAADDAGLRAFMEDVISLYFHRPAPELSRSLLDQMTIRAAPFNRAFFACLAGYDVRDRLGEIGVPALVLGGGDDWVMPVEHGTERLAAAIPGARKRVFGASGHFPFIEESADFLEAITDWWAEFGSGAGP